MSNQLQLAIDTSFFSAKVSLLSGSDCLGVCSREGSSSAEVLNLLVEQVLSESKKELKDLGKIFVIIGPGSFTGLRVGVAAAQAYSLALDIKLVACTSLFALANSLELKSIDNQKVSLQASKTDYFVSTFDFNDSGFAIPQSDVSVDDRETPKHHFKNGLSSDVKEINWSRVIEALEVAELSAGNYSGHIQLGSDLEIVYGKGTSAKTLAERGIKSLC